MEVMKYTPLALIVLLGLPLYAQETAKPTSDRAIGSTANIVNPGDLAPVDPREQQIAQLKTELALEKLKSRFAELEARVKGCASVPEWQKEQADIRKRFTVKQGELEILTINNNSQASKAK